VRGLCAISLGGGPLHRSRRAGGCSIWRNSFCGRRRRGGRWRRRRRAMGSPRPDFIPWGRSAESQPRVWRAGGGFLVVLFCGIRRRAVVAWPLTYGVASARAGSRARAYGSPACARSDFPAGLYPYPLAVRCIVTAGPAVVLFADVLFAAGAGGGVAAQLRSPACARSDFPAIAVAPVAACYRQRRKAVPRPWAPLEVLFL
jgi:hypothetical protein